LNNHALEQADILRFNKLDGNAPGRAGLRKTWKAPQDVLDGSAYSGERHRVIHPCERPKALGNSSTVEQRILA
jgi:hypothetical protein